MAITFTKKSWTDSIITRLSRNVTVLSSTKTIHPLSGEEYLSDSASSTVSMVFYKSEQKWFFNKEGMVEGGDAFGVSGSDVNLVKDDKIQADSETYRVHDKISYYSDDGNNTKLYTYYNLYLVG